MIFANHWVAKKISEAFPSCALLRHHPLPRQEYFSNLIKCANSKGFEIDTSSNRSLAESLDLCTDPDDPTFNMLLRSLATQAMSNALYFSTGSLPQDQFFHYGLALDRYTHFTSPIRRYADIIVHRLLMAAIAKDQNQRTSEFGNIGNKELNELSQHINTKHKAAQQAQKMSVELFQTLYFQQLSEDESCCVLEAVITDIRVNGLLIFVPRFGVKGGIFLKNKQGLVLSPEKHGSKLLFGEGSLSIDEFSATIQNNYGSFKFRLFDHIQVHVSVESSRTHAQSLHFDLLSFEIIQKQENNRLMSNSSNKSKAHRQQLIKDVKQTQDKQLILTTQKPDMGVDFAGLQQQYGQTHPCVSLYNLINDLKQISMTLE